MTNNAGKPPIHIEAVVMVRRELGKAAAERRFRAGYVADALVDCIEQATLQLRKGDIVSALETLESGRAMYQEATG